MREIELKVTIDEANLVLEALGNLPFAKVYPLVAKLQAQASEQLNGDGPAEQALQAVPREGAKAEESAPSIQGGVDAG